MDIQNSHGISQGESDENQRNWSEKQWQNKLQMSDRNYDYTRRNLNFEIADGKVQKIDTSKSIDQKMREMCAARGMRWPNDPNPRRKPGEDDSRVKERNVAACFVFEGSRERMHEIAFGGYGVVDLSRGADNSHVQRSPEIEQWALDTYNWVGRKFGYENIASFYVHLDETNPHIHCDVLPVATVKGKERVSYNKVFGDPSKVGNQQKWRAFHDSYYEEVGSKWGLERGDDIHVTGAKHRNYEQYQEDLRKDIKKCETKIKGLTSMVNNLTNQLKDLQNNKDTTEEELAAVQEKLADKQEKLQKAEDDLDATQQSLDALSDEVAQLEEKRISLAEGATNLMGAKLSSWGDSISRKFKGKDDSIREETRKETEAKIMHDMTQISGSWTTKDKKPYTPTPKEYAEKYKHYKNQASQKAQEAEILKMEKQNLTTKNQTLQSQVNNASANTKRAVADAYSKGFASGKKEIQSKMNRVQSVLFGMWPTAKSAVDAIVTKSNASYAHWLSPEQAESIFNSLKICTPDEREDAARDLIELSKNEVENEAWLEQTAEEVLNIAGNFAQLAVLFAIPPQGAAVSTGGGGGGGNNDLPKKRDDDWWRRVQSILRPSGGFKRKR